MVIFTFGQYFEFCNTEWVSLHLPPELKIDYPKESRLSCVNQNSNFPFQNI